MNKKMISIALIVVLIFSFSTISYGAETNEISITLDGQEIYMDVPPVLQNGRVFVPMRAIFEAMGMTVEWDQEEQKATARKGLVRETLFAYHAAMEVNGRTVSLEAGPIIKDSRILVPVRAVAEGLNACVGWENGNVVITSNKAGYEKYPFAPDFGKMFDLKLEPMEAIMEQQVDDLMCAELTYVYLVDIQNEAEEVTKKYGNALTEYGYAFWKTEPDPDSDPTGRRVYYYNSKTKSVAGIYARDPEKYTSYVMVFITAPVTLEALHLTKTKLNLNQ